jgi:predicted dehydrogenase
VRQLRVAVAGAGFWAHTQTAAWGEAPGVRVAAVADPDRDKALSLANKLGVPAYADAGEMLDRETPDLLDIIAAVPAHVPLVRLAIAKRVPVLCQKPMAETPAECESLVTEAAAAGVWFAVHENWRWQVPLRRVKQLLTEGAIGTPFRARLDMISGFDVFANQPALRTAERFILLDLGCHLFDAACSWFGEADRVFCQTATVRPGVRGEDMATTHLRMGKTAVTVNLAYAGTPLERECFPQTLAFIEGDRGSLELDADFRLKLTTDAGTLVRRVPVPFYPWADPRYAVVQSSMVPCLTDIAESLRAGRSAETSAADNLRTMRLVFAAYESAATGQAVAVSA